MKDKRWLDVRHIYPELGQKIEVLHFGGVPDMEIIDTGIVDVWGICPDAKDGGHGKRSTVTHWRLQGLIFDEVL